jgi:hypothetical protein
LITDRLSKKVLLVNYNGDLISELSPEKCTPGFRWNPQYSFFNKKGYIYVINASPWGYRFSNKGWCLGTMANSFLGTFSFDFTSTGDIVGYYCNSDGNYLKEMDYYGKELSRFGEFPDRFKNLIYRFENGGIIIDKSDNCYQVNLNEPKIMVYNKDHKKINEMYFRPNGFIKIEEDISENPANLMAEIPKKLDGKSIVENIFLLSENILSVQYQKKPKLHGIILFYIDGKIFTTEEILIDQPIIAMSNGLVYFSYQPAQDKNGNLPNPKLLVYKIKRK